MRYQINATMINRERGKWEGNVQEEEEEEDEDEGKNTVRKIQSS